MLVVWQVAGPYLKVDPILSPEPRQSEEIGTRQHQANSGCAVLELKLNDFHFLFQTDYDLPDIQTWGNDNYDLVKTGQTE